MKLPVIVLPLALSCGVVLKRNSQELQIPQYGWKVAACASRIEEVFYWQDSDSQEALSFIVVELITVRNVEYAVTVITETQRPYSLAGDLVGKTTWIAASNLASIPLRVLTLCTVPHPVNGGVEWGTKNIMPNARAVLGAVVPGIMPDETDDDIAAPVREIIYHKRDPRSEKESEKRIPMVLETIQCWVAGEWLDPIRTDAFGKVTLRSLASAARSQGFKVRIMETGETIDVPSTQ